MGTEKTSRKREEFSRRERGGFRCRIRDGPVGGPSASPLLPRDIRPSQYSNKNLLTDPPNGRFGRSITGLHGDGDVLGPPWGIGTALEVCESNLRHMVAAKPMSAVPTIRTSADPVRVT